MKDARLAFADRLKQMCADKDLREHGRQAALARLLKISQPAVKKWFDGEALPEMEKLVDLAIWGGVAIEWLVTGRGAKRISGDPYTAQTQAERTLLAGFRSANETQADIMLDIANKAIGQHPGAEVRAG
jgi:transcriptional regulator with XRE-family HTH domain